MVPGWNQLYQLPVLADFFLISIWCQESISQVIVEMRLDSGSREIGLAGDFEEKQGWAQGSSGFHPERGWFSK